MTKRALEEMSAPPAKIKKQGDSDNEFSGEDGAFSLKEVKDQVVVPGVDYRDQFYRAEDSVHDVKVSELEELDHIVVSAAYQIEQMVLKFQWLRSIDINALENNPKVDRLVKQLLSKYRIRLACVLVKQYWESGIPVLDDLISTRKNTGLVSVPQLCSGDLNAEHLDELQAHVLKSAIYAIKVMRQRVKGDTEFFQQTARTTQEIRKGIRRNHQAKRNHKTESATDPDSDNLEVSNNDGSWPPELPQIDDEALLQQVFTHRSAIVDASLNSIANLLNVHNERLEFKGDSILDFVICDILYSKFPAATEGNLSIMKSTLVCNDTLFDMSVAYKFHERIKMSSDLHIKIFGTKPSPEIPHPVPDTAKKNKAVADVFEAYIAGVAINKGMLVVQQWLRELYAPLIDELAANSQYRAVSDVDKNAKNELYRKIGSADQNIVYETINKNPPFTVVCKVNGVEISRAEDRSMKLAGLRAAEKALKNSKLVETYAAKRRNIPKTAPNTGIYR